jgi:hypothetical protein
LHSNITRSEYYTLILFINIIMPISLLNNSVSLFYSVLNSNLRHLFNYLKSGALQLPNQVSYLKGSLMESFTLGLTPKIDFT